MLTSTYANPLELIKEAKEIDEQILKLQEQSKNLRDDALKILWFLQMGIWKIEDLKDKE